MASGTLGDFNDDLNWRGKCRWTENSKVYTRKSHKKALTPSTNQASTSAQVTAADAEEQATVPCSTATPNGTADFCASEVVVRSEDVDSCQNQSEQEQSRSLDKKTDSSGQVLLLEENESQHVAENGCQTGDRLKEGRRTQSPELADQDKTPSADGEKELVPSLLSENDHPNFHVPQANGLTKVNGSLESPEVAKEQQLVGNEARDDEEMRPASPQASEGNVQGNLNGVVVPLVVSNVDDRIIFNLCKATPKNEIKVLRKNLEHELDQVRRLVKQFESKENQLALHNNQTSNSNLSNKGNYVDAEGANAGDYVQSQALHARSNVVDRRLLLRVNTEMGAMGHKEMRPIGLARVNSDMGAARNLEPRVYSRQFSVAVIDNRSNEFIEKEKRTPKANQYYRNSEFLLGKDRLPSESNKRLKTNNRRKRSGEQEHAMGFGFGFDKNRNQVLKNCSSLLQRLMKHKFSWVFNEPVNAKQLGLVDYHDVIKHPMDLGTIKTRLSQNFYKSPREFADDVRLVFRNAMTYNPKGQDVHLMAEQLSQIFEERWAIIDSQYNSYWKYPEYQEGGLPTPSSRKGVPYSHFGPASVPVSAPAASVLLYDSVAPGRTSERPEPVTPFMAVDRKIHRPHVGRTPVPKKPKAKDPNKRDMTYEEKQRLSTNLQGLPHEKLDAIIQIINKRNTALSQNDDEIEVEIDSVDAETLWELDRFVTNYKKSLSKNKRKAELALQARTMGNRNASLVNSTPALAIQMESRTALKNCVTLVDDDKEGQNRSRTSSSSSSSSDSGSSSSDSDSDSSSGDGSDAEHLPKT
ncbi:transcription factor GTE4-like isoform X1 [Salvia splendens]|uniref:transcription factor GTE4-like isoform X1 n=1 Tax=Salvia splendens TaxID=180675 RepID=UPI001C264F6D|nr:transcription factor GTE4-like isoform X1 [Salvia splendens]XP_042038875.1 transcription factor GTE4-like isoform X1 [Salvia splendens]